MMYGFGSSETEYARGASRGRIFVSARLLGVVVCLLLGVPAAVLAADSETRIDVERLGAVVVDTSKTDRTRIKTAKILAGSQDPRALNYLFEAIGNSSTPAPVRAALLRPLADSPQRQPVTKFLTGLLKNTEESSQVRAAAAAGLGPLGMSESKAALLAYIDDPDPAIRLASRQALLTLGGADVDQVALLGVMLTDRDQPENARSTAARRLATLGDPRALPFLRQALGEELPPLEKPANLAEHLRRVNVTQSLVPIVAARAMGELGDPSGVEDLLAYVEAPAAEMRIAVFEALARLKAETAVPAARTALLKDEDHRVRRWAAVLLRELKNPDTLPDLRRALEEDSDPGVRMQVVQALEAMHDHEALPLIEAALPKEELKEVRAAMEQALITLSAAEKGVVGVPKAN